MTNIKTEKVVLVVAGVFQRGHEFLLFQRLDKGIAPGKWEFPGGKLEENESEKIALQRELLEELSIHVEVGEFIAESFWQSGDRTIHLKAYYVIGETSKIQLVDHQNLQWVAQSELLKFDLAPADIPIVEVLQRSSR